MSKLSFSLALTSALLGFNVANAVSVPACQLVAAPLEKNLTSVRTANTTVPADPFGVAYAYQKDIAFVALDTSLGVLNTSTFAPQLIHQIPLNVSGAAGLSLTHDGRYVVVTAETSPGVVVDTAIAAVGGSNAIVGTLTGNSSAGYGPIEVTISPDDQYAFVSVEYGNSPTEGRGTIEVFKLDFPTTAKANFSSSYVGYLPLDYLIVGTALSPNGSILYATSEQVSQGSDDVQGTLSVIDVEKLETHPSTALMSSVDAGCGAVRIIVSEDGDVVWVTARQSNALLAFDAAKLIANASEPLIASVQVGTLPVGLTFARNQSLILTADSDRFDYTNATTGVSVVNVTAALAGEPAVLGQIPTGLFPREVALSPDGSTILVSDFSSNQVQAIDVATLP